MLHEGVNALALLPNLLLKSRRMSLALFKLLEALAAGALKPLNSLGLDCQLLCELRHKEVLCSESVNMPLLQMESPLKLSYRSLLVLEQRVQLVVAGHFSLCCLQELLELSKELPGRGVGSYCVKSLSWG